jgi:hypothetical protein
MTWGELRAKIEQRPELARHPVVRSLLDPVREMGDRVLAAMNFQRADIPLRIPTAPDPGEMARIRAQSFRAAVSQELEPLKTEIAQLRAALQQRAAPVSTRPTGSAVEAPVFLPPRREVPLSKKRDAGRPTRKREIRRLLVERWVSGVTIRDGLAKEARELERVLLERYKKGVPEGEAAIPEVETIETIIRKLYRRARIRRNTGKYFVARG